MSYLKKGVDVKLLSGGVASGCIDKQYNVPKRNFSEYVILGQEQNIKKKYKIFLGDPSPMRVL